MLAGSVQAHDDVCLQNFCSLFHDNNGKSNLLQYILVLSSTCCCHADDLGSLQDLYVTLLPIGRYDSFSLMCIIIPQTLESLLRASHAANKTTHKRLLEIFMNTAEFDFYKISFEKLDSQLKVALQYRSPFSILTMFTQSFSTLFKCFIRTFLRPASQNLYSLHLKQG